jgi:hypothetical protein
MISDLDESIKQLLVKKGELDPAEVDISFETPDREWAASISKPTVNIYLYDIRENHQLRTMEWVVEKDPNGIATRKKNPNRIDLSYLVTVWTNDIADEHRLLWHVISTLFSYPDLPDDMLAGQLAGLKYPITATTAQPDGLFKNPADFWGALDNQLKPSINYVVTVPLDLEMAFMAPIVRTKVIDFKPPDTAAERLIQVAGMVYQKGKADKVITKARVVAKEVGMTAETDSLGQYAFAKLPQGKHTFQVIASGKKVWEGPISIPSPKYDLEV